MKKYILAVGLSLIFAGMAGAHHDGGVNIEFANKVIIKFGASHHAKAKFMKCLLQLKKFKTADEAIDDKMGKIDEKCKKRNIDDQRCMGLKDMAERSIHQCFAFRDLFLGKEEAAAEGPKMEPAATEPPKMEPGTAAAPVEPSKMEPSAPATPVEPPKALEPEKVEPAAAPVTPAEPSKVEPTAAPVTPAETPKVEPTTPATPVEVPKAEPAKMEPTTTPGAPEVTPEPPKTAEQVSPNDRGPSNPEPQKS